MSASDDRSDPPPFDPAHTARLAEAGAQVARIVHELNAPATLLRGSLDNLAEYIIALLHYVATVQPPLGLPPERDSLAAKSGAIYAADNAASLLQICLQSVQRLTGLIVELREWTDRPSRSLAVAPVDLHAVVADAVQLAVCDRDHRVAVERDVPPEIPWVLANADALVRILTNVLGNALDAVSGLPRPVVRLEARTAAPAAGATGRIVEVRVRDNGRGIPPAERERIFQPFFTTKHNGAGLGLGLAIARELLERSAGSIALIDAAPGAEFIICLPASAPPDDLHRL